MRRKKKVRCKKKKGGRSRGRNMEKEREEEVGVKEVGRKKGEIGTTRNKTFPEV